MFRPRIDWTRPDILERLGAEPDQVLADDLGITRERVRQIRVQHGVRACGDVRRETSQTTHKFELADVLARGHGRLGMVTDATLAAELGVTSSLVREARLSLGIERYRTPCGTPSRYNAGCRCAACRRAQADRMHVWIGKNPDKYAKNRETSRAKVFATAPHRGKRANISKYALGCRCPGCRRAGIDYRAQRTATG